MKHYFSRLQNKKTDYAIILLLTNVIIGVNSLSSSGSILSRMENTGMGSVLSRMEKSGTDSVFSRVENAQCKLNILVGRIPGTAMHPEWASSGAKLSLPLEIKFCKDACTEHEMNKERFLGDNPPFLAVEPLTNPTFISVKGTETVQVTPGAYGCALQEADSKHYSFGFFLDFPNGAIRNDVKLPAERIYFKSSFWVLDQTKIDQAHQRKQEILNEIKNANEKFTEHEKVSTNNVIQQYLNFRQMTILLENRIILENKLKELEKVYPIGDDREYIKGPRGMVFPKEGTISVKRFGGALHLHEQYHKIGTFSLKEFLEEASFP